MEVGGVGGSGLAETSESRTGGEVGVQVEEAADPGRAHGDWISSLFFFFLKLMPKWTEVGEFTMGRLRLLRSPVLPFPE